MAREAIERYVSFDDWFTAEIERGLAAADRGELTGDDEMGRLIEKRFPA